VSGRTVSAELGSGAGELRPDVAMRNLSGSEPPAAIGFAWVGTVALIVGIAVAVILNVSQVLIATHGNPTGVRVVVGIVVLIGVVVLLARPRLGEPAFALLVGFTILFLVAAGSIALSAGSA
jgi:hypothetical protein